MARVGRPALEAEIRRVAFSRSEASSSSCQSWASSEALLAPRRRRRGNLGGRGGQPLFFWLRASESPNESNWTGHFSLTALSPPSPTSLHANAE